jgi:hypothetical protein
MTSTNGSRVGGFRKEVEQERLGPTLAIAASLVLGIRTAKWPATHSEGLSDAEWDKEIEHSVRIARTVLSHLTTRYPELFRSRDVPWYVAADDDVPR